MTSLVPSPSPASVMKQQQSISRQRSATFGSFLRVFTDEQKEAEDKILIATSRAELVALSAKLKAYRDKLRPDELSEFN
eukprot:gene34880-39440_t